jgi:hypothetical protein
VAKENVEQVLEAPELKKLLEELECQKRNGAPLIVDDRFFYVTDSQTKEFDEFEATMGTKDNQSFCNVILSSFDKHISKKKPVSIIDLGVGPSIILLPILDKIASQFSLKEYVAVMDHCLDM